MITALVTYLLSKSGNVPTEKTFWVHVLILFIAFMQDIALLLLIRS